MKSAQTNYGGNVRSSGPHHACRGVARNPNPFDGDLPDHDAVSFVVWSLVIALCFAIPCVAIALIKISN